MAERRSTDAERRFDEVFQSCWLPTFRFALAWTNDWAAAEDLAQEAFARLWTKRQTVDWNRPMLPWLLQVTRRLATDRFRRLRRAVKMTDGQGSTALDADARLRWLDLQAQMTALTPVQRTALVLTAVVGLDYDEAADALETTPGAVRAAVSRARSTLAER